MPTFRVFEWESICVGDSYLDERSDKKIDISLKLLNSLNRWQEAQRNENGHKDFFRVGYNKITFTQWVGVLQINDLVIEVLPKVDNESTLDRHFLTQKWTNALHQMLAEVHKLPLRKTEDTSLNIRRQSLMDLYYRAFLDEVNSLLRKGLIKKYRLEERNRTKLKGKLNFNQQIQKNLIHKERFYTSAQEYDRQNDYNEILLAALKMMTKTCLSQHLKSEANTLQLEFPDWKEKYWTSESFKNLVFDRKTKDYNKAMKLARLILLEMNPQFQSGNESVLALFFDMNRLWEDWLLIQFKKLARVDQELKVLGKKRTDFWESEDKDLKILETDILVQYKGSQIVFDAKWKLPKDNKPGDDELKQMFVYNLMYGAKKSILLFPAQNGVIEILKGNFKKSRFQILDQNGKELKLGSNLAFLNFVDHLGRLNSNWLSGLLILNTED